MRTTIHGLFVNGLDLRLREWNLSKESLNAILEGSVTNFVEIEDFVACESLVELKTRFKGECDIAVVGTLTARRTYKSSGKLILKWELSDLKDSKFWVVLYSPSSEELVAEKEGTVWAILNPKLRPKQYDSLREVAVSDVADLMKIGLVSGLSNCKGVTKLGAGCKIVVYSQIGEYCKYHQSQRKSRNSKHEITQKNTREVNKNYSSIEQPWANLKTQGTSSKEKENDDHLECLTGKSSLFSKFPYAEVLLKRANHSRSIVGTRIVDPASSSDDRNNFAKHHKSQALVRREKFTSRAKFEDTKEGIELFTKPSEPFLSSKSDSSNKSSLTLDKGPVRFVEGKASEVAGTFVHKLSLVQKDAANSSKRSLHDFAEVAQEEKCAKIIKLPSEYPALSKKPSSALSSSIENGSLSESVCKTGDALALAQNSAINARKSEFLNAKSAYKRGGLHNDNRLHGNEPMFDGNFKEDIIELADPPKANTLQTKSSELLEKYPDSAKNPGSSLDFAERSPLPLHVAGNVDSGHNHSENLKKCPANADYVVTTEENFISSEKQQVAKSLDFSAGPINLRSSMHCWAQKLLSLSSSSACEDWSALKRHLNLASSHSFITTKHEVDALKLVSLCHSLLLHKCEEVSIASLKCYRKFSSLI